MALKVFIADDSRTVRDVIRSYLEEKKDVQVCGDAENGREALEKALALKPDVLILDVVMPELNGIEVAALVKQHLPSAKTILFTMFGDAVGPNLAKTAGVHIILPKPEGLMNLMTAIDSLLGHGQLPVSESQAFQIPPVKTSLA
jgi:two-component system, NarL family, response regulator LiaR